MQAAKIPPCEQTVRFRYHSDGSLTILSLDGKTVLGVMDKSQLDGPRYINDDPGAETRGFMIGAVLSSLFWLLVVAWLFR